MYQEIGDYPGGAFFDVDTVTGHVTVVRSLRLDALKLSTYTVCYFL